jgi:hypothetical protein
LVPNGVGHVRVRNTTSSITTGKPTTKIPNNRQRERKKIKDGVMHQRADSSPDKHIQNMMSTKQNPARADAQHPHDARKPESIPIAVQKDARGHCNKEEEERQHKQVLT